MSVDGTVCTLEMVVVVAAVLAELGHTNDTFCALHSLMHLLSRFKHAMANWSICKLQSGSHHRGCSTRSVSVHAGHYSFILLPTILWYGQWLQYNSSCTVDTHSTAIGAILKQLVQQLSDWFFSTDLVLNTSSFARPIQSIPFMNCAISFPLNITIHSLLQMIYSFHSWPMTVR